MRWFRRGRHLLTRQIWRADLATLSRPRRSLFLVLRAVALAVRGFRKHRASVWAASLTYISLLSLVPFAAVLIVIGARLGVPGRAVEGLVDQIPPNQLELFQNAAATLESMDLSAIGAVAVLLLLLAVVRTLTQVEKSFNDVWGLEQGRSLGRRLTGYVFVAVVAPLLVFSAMALSAAVLSSSVVKSMEGLPLGGWVLDAAILLVPYVAVLLALAVLYWLMPNTRVRITSALVGACVAGILWQVVQKAYFAAQVGVSGWGVVYGALAAFPMFLIWLYISWLVVLFGTEISYGAQHAAAYAFERGEVKLSQDATERTGLRIALLMASRFAAGHRPLDPEGISLALGIPARLVNRILGVLRAQGLVSVLESGGVQIARSPAHVTAADVVQGMRTEGARLPDREDVPPGAGDSIDSLRRRSLEVLQVSLEKLVDGTVPCEEG